MNDSFCLNPRYSTTRLVSRQQPAVNDDVSAKISSILFQPDCPDRIGLGGLRTKGYFKKSSFNKPLVSVITVMLNAKRHFEQTIKSVVGQTYDNTEYIIIDGGSTDGTLDIIRRYDEAIDYWISEPDEGVSDAFNKGIALSKGDYIQLVNADDWLSANQIETAVNSIKKYDCDFVYGDLIFHDGNGKVLFVNKGEKNYERKIYREMPRLNHPCILAGREMYQKIGGFDLDYKVAMDYEWLLRAHKAGFKGIYVSDIVGHMRRAGLSDNNFTGGHREVLKASLRYGYPSLLAYLHFFYRVSRGKIRRFIEPVLPLGIRQRIMERLKEYL